MTLTNQQITYYKPAVVSHSIQIAMRTLANTFSGKKKMEQATNHCLDCVPNLTEPWLTKLRGKNPPGYTRDGQVFVSLIWVLLQDAVLPNRRDAYDWLESLLNATDLIEGDMDDANWSQVIRIFADNVVFHDGILTPSIEEITQTFSQLKTKQTQSSDTIGRQIPSATRIFVGRDDNLNDLKTRLGVTDKTTRHAFNIVRGWPGVGKTALVNTLIHDETVEDAFEHGLLWAILGPDADLQSTLKSWAQQLGASHLLSLVNQVDLVQGLRAVLAGQDILIVVDDVWEESHGKIIKRIVDLNANTVLLTTRFTEVAKKLRDNPKDEYMLKSLSEKYAVELLTKLAPDVVDKHGKSFPALAQAVECLPLALCVAGPLLQHYHEYNLPIAPLFEEFESSYERLLGSVAPADRVDEKTGSTPTIELLFQRSVETLSEENQFAFASLGVFAHKPATFGTDAMASVWETDDLITTLFNIIGRGLLEPVPDSRYYMHRTLHLYANKLIDNYDATGKLF